MASRGIKTVLWGTGSIFLSVGTLLLGLAGGFLGGWALFAGSGGAVEAADCPEPSAVVQCPECPDQAEGLECPECKCEDEPEAKPTPRPRRPSTPRPAPVPEPEPEAEASEARVIINGDIPTELWFQQGGMNMGTGPLAPGTYELIVAFGEDPATVKGTVTISEGQSALTINCSQTYRNCRAQQ